MIRLPILRSYPTTTLAVMEPDWVSRSMRWQLLDSISIQPSEVQLVLGVLAVKLREKSQTVITQLGEIRLITVEEKRLACVHSGHRQTLSVESCLSRLEVNEPMFLVSNPFRPNQPRYFQDFQDFLQGRNREQHRHSKGKSQTSCYQYMWRVGPSTNKNEISASLLWTTLCVMNVSKNRHLFILTYC